MAQACYLHVPFCRHICAYCDFTRCGYHETLADKWISAVVKEIQEKLQAPLKTMYIGGGTPSALSYEQLNVLLTALDPYIQECEEYTMEANIESFSEDKIALCYRHGVNRISLGVQTLQPKLLNIIERKHTKEEVLSKIKEIKKNGIDNISIDLIYGLPEQTMTMWKEDLEEIVTNFPIEHISLYALTIEEHSKFGRMGVKNIDPEVEEDMYAFAQEYLPKHGFYQYEISNFSKQGKESKHNCMYWKYEDFYGIGCGSSGKEQHVRYDNTKNIHTYITQGSVANCITLNKEDEMFELIMMNLRLKKGMDLNHFKELFQVDFEEKYASVLQKQIGKGMLAISNGYIKATEKGYPLLNDILIDFME